MTVLASEQNSAISRLFSSSVVRELARKGKSPLFARLAKQSHLFDPQLKSGRVYDVFDNAFSQLKKAGNRHEYVYKAALIEKVLLGQHSLKTAAMLHEFRVGDCIADLAILNGTSTVYEVKSERDTLARLDRQVTAYSTVFARIYVIAAESHVPSVIAAVPNEVGILQLNSRYQIHTVRKAVDRHDQTSPMAIFRSIRTAEARMILRAQGIEIPTVPNTEMHAALGNLFAQLSATAAHDGMVKVLKKTRDLTPLADLISELPDSLQTAALSVPLRKSDHARLITAINTRIQDAMEWA